MRLWDLPLPSVNYLSGRGSFCQLSSTLLESAGPSVNLCQIFTVPQDLLSKFSASVGPFVNFCQLYVHPQYLPSTSVNFLCTRGIFRKKSAQLQNLPSTSVDFPCICRTYCKLASIYREAGGPSANFPYVRLTCEHSLRPQDLSTLFNFPLLLGSSSSSTEIPTLNS